MEVTRKEPGVSEKFISERKRTRFFFNLAAALYPLIEFHLFPCYQETLGKLSLPSELNVLDVATGSGILAAAFSRRGHRVCGLDFSERLLKRARKRFRNIDFKIFDLINLAEIPASSYGIVSTGYLLHGLSEEFRETILKNIGRIAAEYVVIFDYGSRGGWFVRLIERVEGSNYLQFVSTSREIEFGRAGLKILKTCSTSAFGNVWLCKPEHAASN